MITFSKLGKYGRLGNQLWQIASTIGIAMDNGLDYGFPVWQYQQYFSSVLPKIPESSVKFLTVREVKSAYNKLNLDPSYNWDLEGYFQSFKYFDKYEQTIKDLFCSHIETNDVNLDNVAIHVRRGDYLNYTNVHPVFGMEYYRNAMDYFPNRGFTVFSDDIEWCKAVFDHKKCTFVLPTTDILDFLYMSRHKDFIIANSSYSWWAAWLNDNPYKQVIAPSIWAYNEPISVMNDRIPQDWVTI